MPDTCAAACGRPVLYPDGLNLRGGRVVHRACAQPAGFARVALVPAPAPTGAL